MFLDRFHSVQDGHVVISALQASQFAKEIAGDFNPIHDPDARRAQAQALLAAFLGLRVLVKAGVEEQALIEAKDAALATLRQVAAA